MSMDAMRRFPEPDIEELPSDIRERIVSEQERAGFIPNVFLAYAARPSHFRVFFAYYDALIEESNLSRAEIEMIIVVTSASNDCLYCVVAHGALLRIYGDNPQLADQLATNFRSADLSEKHRTMLEFVVALTESPGEVDDAHVEALTDAGFSRSAIWDVASVTAFFNLSNRMAAVTDMRPNEEFYALGR